MTPSPRFTIAEPPRRVPSDVSRCLWFGGYLSQTAWGVLAAGLAALAFFGGNADVLSWYHFRGPVVHAEGRITATEKTSFSEGSSRRSRRSGRRIFAYHYRFSDAHGNEHASTSYQPGNRGSSDAPPVSPVVVEYPEGRPELSRLAGMRRRPLSKWAGLVAIGPLVGLVLLMVSLRRAAGWSRLLHNGVPAAGRLIERKQTASKVNKKRVFKLTFEFKASDGTTHRAVARTHITETLEDEPFETVLYDPHNPSHNLMLDGLPGAIRFDESGAPVVGAPRKALTYLILPLVSLIAAAGTAVVLMKML